MAGQHAIDGVSLAVRHAPDGVGAVDRVMPVALAVRWAPAEGCTALGATSCPIFITVAALAAVREHVAATPEDVSIGFLTGSRLRCPKSGTPYIVINSTIPLPSVAAGEDTKRALARAWTTARQSADSGGALLLGWYHGHSSADATLSPGDVDTHVTFFTRPWHVALVIATGSGLSGGVFRRSSDVGWPRARLPFYELPDGRPGEGVGPELGWSNYRVVEQPALRPDRPPPLPVVLDPGADEDLPRAAQPRSRPRRALRFAAYGTVGVLAAAGLGRMYEERAPAAERTTAFTPQPRLARAADTLALAVAAFDVRARLFENQQAQCADLARGLVLVEERWREYNAARAVDRVVLDSSTEARDRALYADVGAVERRFGRTPCARP